jgi:hypothetical protein
MARRKGLTEKQIAALPRRSARYAVSDPEMRNLYLRIPPHGAITYTVIVKQRGKQTWEVVGNSDDLGIDEARERARGIIKRIKRGELRPQPPQSVAAVAQGWLDRHVAKSQLRSERELRRIVSAYIVPAIGNADFKHLRRSDIVAFLDRIEDRHGPHTADAVLSTLRSIAGWLQSRDDGYVLPFTRGMRRVPARQRQRSRVLSDDELRIVWRAADEAGLLGDIIKLLALTCQRREHYSKCDGPILRTVSGRFRKRSARRARAADYDCRHWLLPSSTIRHAFRIGSFRIGHPPRRRHVLIGAAALISGCMI